MIYILEDILKYISGFYTLPWILIGFFATILIAKVTGKEKIDNIKLIIIGTGNQYDRLKRMSSGDKDIIMTGFIPDEDLLITLEEQMLLCFHLEVKTLV